MGNGPKTQSESQNILTKCLHNESQTKARFNNSWEIQGAVGTHIAEETRINNMLSKEENLKKDYRIVINCSQTSSFY